MPDPIPVGFSSTVIGSSPELGRLVDYDADVVELCGYGPDQWLAVRAAAKRFGVPVGLHCPLPFNGWVSYFDITGPDHPKGPSQEPQCAPGALEQAGRIALSAGR